MGYSLVKKELDVLFQHQDTADAFKRWSDRVGCPPTRRTFGGFLRLKNHEKHYVEHWEDVEKLLPAAPERGPEVRDLPEQLETVVHDRAHRRKIPCVAPHSHDDGEGDHSQEHSEPADEISSAPQGVLKEKREKASKRRRRCQRYRGAAAAPPLS